MKIRAGMTLGQALKVSGAVSTGGEAKIRVQTREVSVNGQVETRRGRKLDPGDVIEIKGERLEVE